MLAVKICMGSILPLFSPLDASFFSRGTPLMFLQGGAPLLFNEGYFYCGEKYFKLSVKLNV